MERKKVSNKERTLREAISGEEKRNEEMQIDVKTDLNDRIIHERKKKPVSILSECVC